MKKAHKKILLRLRVPRLNTRGPLAFEQILASLHGLLSKSAKRIENETISFEIVKLDGNIYFYIVTPSHLRTLISSQIYSQYKEVEIETVPEYFTKKLVKDKKILTATLRPSEPYVFPFKRYPQFEDKLNQILEDPLGPVSSALSQLHKKDDSAIIQFVISPVSPSWNKIAQKTLRRFSGYGPWKWNWVRTLYQWARLSPSKRIRIIRSPIWITMLFLFGWGGLKKISATQNFNENDEDDQNLDRESQTSGRHDRETIFSASYDKLTRLNFATNIRAIYIHSDNDDLHAEAKIREIAGTFQQFSLPQMNHFSISSFSRETNSQIFKNIVHRTQKKPFVLSQEELATIFHLPTETVTTPAISWVDSVKLEPPTNLPQEGEKGVTLIGQTNFRNHNQKYGIREIDRRRHVYVIGKTGMGKSTLLENMIRSDLEAGKGVCVIDPHGDLAEAVLRFIPKKRTNDVIIFDPSDREFPLAFNMLEGKNPEQRSLIASGLIGVIKKLNEDSWGPRLEHFLRNTVLALVEAPDTTMLGITRMLVDPIYRQKILHFVKDPMVLSFWKTEFSALSPAKLAEAVGPIQNKVGQFLSTPIIRNIVGQPKSTLDLRFAMDTGKIVIVNLSKGKIGEDNSTMLGSMMITKFQIDAMSRADIPEKDRRDFSLFVDEFQNFATDSFATILSEARKYKLSLTMANQYLAQMSDEVAAAVFGNVGSLLSFQVGIDDAKILSEQFDEERIQPIHLASLPKYKAYNRIMVDGMTTPVFSADTLPSPNHEEKDDPEIRIQKIVNFSRQRYTKPKKEVEDKIMRWTKTDNDKRLEKTKKNDSTNKKKPNDKLKKKS
ncbi:type IV secretion system DNA-binding domain-containing protein [Candidatus Gracilibacteria bacterium]|nr:type IV secretion system DNA-binding domain-containing protein [Candidatus Gracilibacteria bacterium]